MPADTPIAITSQFVEVEFEADAGAAAWEASVNKALGLVKDDLQRLAGRPMPALPVVSGSYRAVMPATGKARVYTISDTPSTGSSGANYIVLSATRNGTTPLSLRYDTRQTEIVAYRGGMYLGELTVSAGDVVAVAISTTGAPTALTLDNFSLLIDLKET